MGDLAIALQAIKESCSEYLTDDDIVCITSKLSGLITKRQVTYNLVQESVAFGPSGVHATREATLIPLRTQTRYLKMLTMRSSPVSRPQGQDANGTSIVWSMGSNLMDR